MSLCGGASAQPRTDGGGRELRVYRDPAQRGADYRVWVEARGAAGHRRRIEPDSTAARLIQAREPDLVAAFQLPPGEYRVCAEGPGAAEVLERHVVLSPTSADYAGAVPHRLLLTAMAPAASHRWEALLLYLGFGLAFAAFVIADQRGRGRRLPEIVGWPALCAVCFLSVTVYLWRWARPQVLLGLEPALWQQWRESRRERRAAAGAT